MNNRVMATGDTTSLADWKRNAGQRLVIGLPYAHVDDDSRRLIREMKPAGFILFKRNVEDPAQVRELNRELASLVDSARPALLSIDQEGGRVQRVRAPATVWPSMRVVGRAEAYTAAVSKAMARELRAMGFNLNYAPVADIDSNPKNPVIGDRAFAASAKAVSAHVVAYLAAHQAEGVVACAKHFPGHGDTTVDSHLALPIVEKEEPELREMELAPFAAAVRAGVGAVMTAHVIFPAFDEELPATLSARVTKRLLRDEMGYDGVVFSDDLEMKAVHGRWGIETTVDKATWAGVDVFLACESQKLQLEAFESMVRQCEQEPTFARACTTSAKRVMTLRERFFLGERPPLGLDIVGCREHQDLALLVAARGAA